MIERKQINVSSARNETLDLLKLLASYAVVFIHVPFYGKIGSTVNALARFAVPLFFLSSGFFSYNIPRSKIKQRAFYIFKLFIIAVCLYCSCYFLIACIQKGLDAAINSFISQIGWKSILKFIVFNEPFFTSYAWYLLSILYVYVAHYFAHAFMHKNKPLLILSCLILLTNISLKTVFSILEIPIPSYFLRNFLFMGIPFYCLGLVCNNYKPQIKNIRSYVVVLLLLAGVCETILSRTLLGVSDLHIGSILILFACVIIFIKYENKKYPPFIVKLSSCSTIIYLSHVLVGWLVTLVFKGFSINTLSPLFMMLRPILVCIFATLVALCFESLKQKNKRSKLFSSNSNAE